MTGYETSNVLLTEACPEAFAYYICDALLSTTLECIVSLACHAPTDNLGKLLHALVDVCSCSQLPVGVYTA